MTSTIIETRDEGAMIRAVADAAVAARDNAHLPITPEFEASEEVREAWFREQERLAAVLDRAIEAWKGAA